MEARDRATPIVLAQRIAAAMEAQLLALYVYPMVELASYLEGVPTAYLLTYCVAACRVHRARGLALPTRAP